MYKKLSLTEPDTLGLLPLQEAIYSIYDDFAAICNRHGLRHYALGGTLLGAVRHKGFIPWDDDLDVAMPRPDYERFMELAKHELPPHLKFMNWQNAPEMEILFGKVQETRQKVVEDLEKRLGATLSYGVYIDIFPLDGYPASKMQRGMLKLKHMVLAPIWHYHTRDFNECRIKGKLAILLGWALAHILPGCGSLRDLEAIYDSDAKRFPYDGCERVADVSIFQDIFHFPPQLRSSWGVPQKHMFNGENMMVPENPDDPLTSRFGKSYMTPPPVYRRQSTHRWGKHFSWWLGPT